MDSEIATVLNDVAAKINMQPVSIEYTDRPLNEVYPEATYWTPAIYDRNANKIVVNRNGDFSRYGSLENVLLHEIAHAITLDSLASNTEAANELRKIQKNMQKSMRIMLVRMYMSLLQSYFLILRSFTICLTSLL